MIKFTIKIYQFLSLFGAFKEISITSGSGRNNQICFWLFMTIFALQVNTISMHKIYYSSLA